MHRFFIDHPLALGQVCELPTEVSHHIGKVLRLRNGESIGLWNGDGRLRTAQLHLSRDGASALIEHQTEEQAASPLAISLIQALPEGDKMDWIIEKACEAGVTEIWPVVARRSVVRLDGTRLERRQAHWRRIAIAACSQCGRARLPVIHPLIPANASFERAREAHPTALPWLLSPAAEQTAMASLQNHLKNPDNASAGKDAAPTASLMLAVGPEGGWEANEQKSALAAGWQAVTLHGWVLRTETAGLFATAQALAWQQAVALSTAATSTASRE